MDKKYLATYKIGGVVRTMAVVAKSHGHALDKAQRKLYAMPDAMPTLLYVREGEKWESSQKDEKPACEGRG